MIELNNPLENTRDLIEKNENLIKKEQRRTELTIELAYAELDNKPDAAKGNLERAERMLEDLLYNRLHITQDNINNPFSKQANNIISAYEYLSGKKKEKPTYF